MLTKAYVQTRSYCTKDVHRLHKKTMLCSNFAHACIVILVEIHPADQCHRHFFQTNA